MNSVLKQESDVDRELAYWLIQQVPGEVMNLILSLHFIKCSHLRYSFEDTHKIIETLESLERGIEIILDDTKSDISTDSLAQRGLLCYLGKEVKFALDKFLQYQIAKKNQVHETQWVRLYLGNRPGANAA